jgi:AcrR family transcriptional regulator
MEQETRLRLGRDERRQQILTAAAEVFGRLGFEAARMEDVAKSAGIAKGLLYKHFSSKDLLFRALVDQQGTAYASELRSALSDAGLDADPRAALRAGLALWLGKIGDRSGGFNLTDPGAHDAYGSVRDSLRAVIAEAFRAAAPEIPEPYPRLVAALIQGAAENLGLVWRADAGPVTEDEALAMLTAFCWGGIEAMGRATGLNQ